ncbi:hypothetical protein AGMMS49975_19650 [Clostridia bacterium]|nr:hypothetical protein AGMMS49975_19650 [Clostridia bacterium]
MHDLVGNEIVVSQVIQNNPVLLFEKNLRVFGMNLIHIEYAARIILTLTAIGVLVTAYAVGSGLSALVIKQESRKETLMAELENQRHISEYERDIVVRAAYINEAEQAAREIAVIQNKYIIAVLEDTDDFDIADTDYEMRIANYLQEPTECAAWINMRDREELKKLFLEDDYYWVGYADNTPLYQKPDSVPVFFILYDAGYPIQVIEYEYRLPTTSLMRGDDKNGVLRY